MRYPAAETAAKHQRVLDEATRLFRGHGFDGVSIPEIMQSAGLTHGSFHNHFASKVDLMNACIHHGATTSLSGIDTAPPSERGKVAYVNDYLSKVHRDDPGSGCLMSALGSEIHRDPLVQETMTRFIQSYIDKIAKHFPWANLRRARRKSIRLTASLVGGMVLARAVNVEALSAEILREVLLESRRASARYELYRFYQTFSAKCGAGLRSKLRE